MTRWMLILFLLLASVACLTSSHATVNAPSPSAANRYTGDGNTTVFNYTFEIYDQTALTVSIDGAVKTIGVDYTVSGVNNSGGGSITMLAAPATGTIVTLLRNQPPSQLSVYTPNEPFPAKRIEHDLDKVVMQVQQLKEQMNRALLLNPQSTYSGQFVDDPTTTGLFARAKVGGGIDWASVTSSGTITIPVPVNEGGTGATTAATAAANLSVLPLVSGNVSQDILFVDNNYDIGKTGATRPRDLFLSRNATIGGTLTVSGLIDASGASAGQFKFPATQNPSANANTLDDYEEGTWVPAVGGSATYTLQQGTYTKIGRQVTVYGALSINAIGTGGTYTISGLPFQSASTGIFSGTVTYASAVASFASIIAQITQNSSSVTLVTVAAAGASSQSATTAVLGNGTVLTFTITYFTS